jgi:hypothetical protein
MKHCAFILVLASFVFGQYFDSLYYHPAPKGILDSKKKTFLWLGYSTSRYPQNGKGCINLFQEMLNKHAGNENTYKVFAVLWFGHELAQWMGDICGDVDNKVEDNAQMDGAIAGYIKPGNKLGDWPPASVMITQNSIGRCFGDCSDRVHGIRDSLDFERIDMGAKAFAAYARYFLNAGVDRVYIGTHIWWESSAGSNPWTDIWLERYALSKAMDMDSRIYGVESCPITHLLYDKDKADGEFGDYYSGDRIHPGQPVAWAMALEYYLTIAGEDARESIIKEAVQAAGLAPNEIPQRGRVTSPPAYGKGVVASAPENRHKPVATQPHIAPHRGGFTISTSPRTGKNRVEIRRTDGARVGGYSVRRAQNEITITSLPSGIYLIRLTGSGGNIIRQIIIVP